MSDSQKTRIDVDVPDLPVKVHAQYVKDFSFENPNAPEILRPSQSRPEMDINITLDASKIADAQFDHLYESVLNLTAKATRDGKVAFIAQISYAALVSFENPPADRINPVLFIDVPQLIFPFARQMIATATAGGGFPPLFLNPVDFRGMFLAQKRQQKQAVDPVAANA